MSETELVWGSAPYETRLTVYFDILGWREHIAEAGGDPARLARLRAVLATFSIFVNLAQGNGAESTRVSTFSDNVVISAEWNPDRYPVFVEGIARL